MKVYKELLTFLAKLLGITYVKSLRDRCKEIEHAQETTFKFLRKNIQAATDEERILLYPALLKCVQSQYFDQELIGVLEIGPEILNNCDEDTMNRLLLEESLLTDLLKVTSKKVRTSVWNLISKIDSWEVKLNLLLMFLEKEPKIDPKKILTQLCDMIRRRQLVNPDSLKQVEQCIITLRVKKSLEEIILVLESEIKEVDSFAKAIGELASSINCSGGDDIKRFLDSKTRGCNNDFVGKIIIPILENNDMWKDCEEVKAFVRKHDRRHKRAPMKVDSFQFVQQKGNIQVTNCKSINGTDRGIYCMTEDCLYPKQEGKLTFIINDQSMEVQVKVLNNKKHGDLSMNGEFTYRAAFVPIEDQFPKILFI